MTSGADGTFAIEGIAAGRYAVVATHDELYARANLRADGPSIDLIAKPIKRLAVTVRDETGAPIANARITYDGWAETTDADGRAHMPYAGNAIRARVDADGFASGSVALGKDLDGQPADAREVVLARGAPIRGVVLDSTGAPAAASVQVRGPSGGTVATQADGNWELLAAAGTYELAARSDTEVDEPRITIVHDGRNAIDNVVVRTAAAAELVVTVVHVDGTPAPHAWVLLFAMRPMSLHPGRCSDAGVLHLRGIAPETYCLYAGSDTEHASRMHELVLERSTRSEVRLVLEPNRAIAGIVVDARGQPVPDIGVDASFYGAPQVISDEHGRFYIPGLPDPAVGDSHRLLACPPGGRLTTSGGSAAARPGDMNVRIVMPATTTVRGRVTYLGAPCTYFGITIADGRLVTTIRDVDGRFTQLIKGAVNLEILALGSARTVIAVTPPTDGGELDLGTIALGPGQRISGRVTTANGNPVPDARVSIKTDRGRGDRELELAFGNHYATTTDDDGRYVFAGISIRLRRNEPPARLAATHPQLGSSEPVPVPTGDATIDLVVR